MNSFKNKHWIGFLRVPDGEEDRRKPGQGPLWKKQENVAKHEARLRGWRATGSDENASQMPFVPNGTKGYTTTNKWYLLQTTC